MPLDRSDTEIFQAFHESVKDDHRKCIPATITAVHATRGTVDVVPAILNPLFDEFGSVSFEQLPSLSDVPIGIMRGGGFLVWLPVAVGDSVLVIFSDLSTDSWRAGASAPTPSRPNFVGKHTPAGPFAIPCVAPDMAMLSQPGMTPGKLVVGKDGADTQIQISASEIDLGRHPTSFVALSNLVDTAVTTIVTAFNAHTHALSVTVPFITAGLATATGTGITTSLVTPITPAPGSVAAALVKAQ